AERRHAHWCVRCSPGAEASHRREAAPMSDRLPRYRTGDADVDRRLAELLDTIGARENRDQLFEILVSAVGLASDDASRLDLKIANAALKEMRSAYATFAPYRGVPKVTMFGSARTELDEALELLTLVQTGKTDPVPMVLLEVPGGTYWQSWSRFVADSVLARDLVSPDDVHLYRVTDDVREAADEILGFYRNYVSRRFVG